MIKNLVGEEWRDIEGFEGRYQVSNMGRVKSLPRDKVMWNCVQHFDEIIMSPGDNGNGYKIVNLCKNSKQKINYVHRLVSKAFLPNPNGYKYVNHKDEIKSHNWADNLEWCTAKYNNNYGNNTKMGRARIREKLRKPICQYTIDGVFIRKFDAGVDVRKYGLKRSNISYNVEGHTKSSSGYVFIFEGEKFNFTSHISNYIYKYDLNNNYICNFRGYSKAEEDNSNCKIIRGLKKSGEHTAIIDGFKYVF